jgi:hypothetical protein
MILGCEAIVEGNWATSSNERGQRKCCMYMPSRGWSESAAAVVSAICARCARCAAGGVRGWAPFLGNKGTGGRVVARSCVTVFVSSAVARRMQTVSGLPVSGLRRPPSAEECRASSELHTAATLGLEWGPAMMQERQAQPQRCRAPRSQERGGRPVVTGTAFKRCRGSWIVSESGGYTAMAGPWASHRK